jgi:hypothetical protein
MKFIIAALVGLFAFLSPQQTVVLVDTEITPKLKMLIPNKFTRLSNSDAQRLFMTGSEPLGAFSSDDKQAALLITEALNQFDAKDAEMMKIFTKSKISLLFKNVKYIKEDIKKVSKKTVLILEFTAEAENNQGKLVKKYNYLQYMIMGNTVITFNFYCKQQDMGLWKPYVETMMNSVKAK